jgi:hypothetical protein
MAKNSNTITFIVIGIILVLIIVPNLGLFAITGNERMTRSFPALVNRSTQLEVVYTVSQISGGNWGASVLDNVSCKDPLGNIVYDPITMSQKFVFLSQEGSSVASVTKIIAVPNAYDLNCTFTGTYQFGNKTIQSFPSQSFRTEKAPIVCPSGADTSKNGIVDRTELAVYISGWISGTITRTKLGQAIQEWADGTCG